MAGDIIELTKNKGIATITLNRPEVLNAVNRDFMNYMPQIVDDIDRDEDVRVVVITGTGRAFSVGGDLHDFPLDLENPTITKDVLASWHKVLVKIRALNQPVIAAVRGPAMGAGCDLALVADMRIVTEDAKFSEAYVRVGIPPDSGGTYLLPRLIGIARASEMLFTDRAVDAQEALRIGLVNMVVTSDELEKVVADIAGAIAKGPKMAIGMIKRAIYRSQYKSLETELEQIASDVSICAVTDDVKEGIAAFNEKRAPVFK